MRSARLVSPAGPRNDSQGMPRPSTIGSPGTSATKDSSQELLSCRTDSCPSRCSDLHRRTDYGANIRLSLVPCIRARWCQPRDRTLCPMRLRGFRLASEIREQAGLGRPAMPAGQVAGYRTMSAWLWILSFHAPGATVGSGAPMILSGDGSKYGFSLYVESV